MTTPDPQIPDDLRLGTQSVSSCSRFVYSWFSGPSFAGAVRPEDLFNEQNQELMLAYLMGTVRLLVSKGIATEAEWLAEVQDWLAGRKLWAQRLTNNQVNTWNANNQYPLVDIDDPGPVNVQPADLNPLWPWMHENETGIPDAPPPVEPEPEIP